MVDEEQDAERHQDAIQVAGNGIGDEQGSPRSGHVALHGDFQAQHLLLEQVREELRALDPQVGDLQPVGHDVVAVVAEERVGVEQDRVDRADDHRRQAEAVQEALLGVEPDEGRDAGQEAFDVDAGRRDPDAFPLAGQEPAIGHVAIERRGEDQEEHPHLVDLAAEVLGGQAVAELVDDLDDRQAAPEIEDGVPVEEALEVGHPRAEGAPLADDQRQRREHQADAEGHEVGREDPAEVGVHPREELLRVDDGDIDVEDVGEELPDLLPAVLLAAGDERLGLVGAVDLDDARLVQLRRESRQVLHRDRLRAVLPLEGLLDVEEGLRAVELLEQEIFLDLEPEILQRDRVLDDVVRHPLVELRLDDEVAAQLDPKVLGRLPGGCGGGHGGGGAHRSTSLEIR